MGYYMKIGNALPVFSKENRRLYAGWEVAKIEDALKPKGGNSMLPSYGGWDLFCKSVGLQDLFYARCEGLLHEHPGCVLLKEEHHKEVLKALEAWRTVYSSNNVDHKWFLENLEWLEFWIQWALDNCETPAFDNQ